MLYDFRTDMKKTLCIKFDGFYTMLPLPAVTAT